MRVAFRTLGCKVNQVETEQIKENFLARGYKVVAFTDKADIYIINTCTVTHISDRKSRSAVRRAGRQNPEAVIAAVGCLPQVDPAQLSTIEGINLIVGNSDKEKLVDIIEEYLAEQKADCRIVTGSFCSGTGLNTIDYGSPHQRSRGFIKIQDGCENFCSYCIVPYARGPVRSKTPLGVLTEIEKMLDLGYRELVLTGINTGLYGNDIPDWNLGRLMEEVFARIPGHYRIRLSSIEPLEISRSLIDVAASEPRFCRHLHIPLQSGSDRILQAMNRKYDRVYFANLLHEITGRIEGIAITTDVIVGFPGENETDFEQSRELLQEMPVYDLHVFPYSARSGTPAAEMADQVEEADKHRRSQLLLDLAREKKKHFIQGLYNRKVEVLVEKRIEGSTYQGLSDNYVPIYLQSENDITRKLVPVVVGVDGTPV